jgi:hypothetical protein
MSAGPFQRINETNETWEQSPLGKDPDQFAPGPKIIQRDGEAIPLIFREHSNETFRNYWFSGRSAWHAASLAIAAPVGCTRTTASSNEQKLRVPVWFRVIGTPVA